LADLSDRSISIGILELAIGYGNLNWGCNLDFGICSPRLELESDIRKSAKVLK
jgi:hypothetical protein